MVELLLCVNGVAGRTEIEPIMVELLSHNHGGAGRAKVEHVMVEPLLCSRGGTDRVVECVEVKLLLRDRDGAAVTWQWQCGINVVC